MATIESAAKTCPFLLILALFPPGAGLAGCGGVEDGPAADAAQEGESTSESPAYSNATGYVLRASPSSCTVGSNGLCSTTISLDPSGAYTPGIAAVYVQMDSDAQQLFACFPLDGHRHEQMASWIQADHTYTFKSYSVSGCLNAISSAPWGSVVVKGYDSPVLSCAVDTDQDGTSDCDEPDDYKNPYADPAHAGSAGVGTTAHQERVVGFSHHPSWDGLVVFRTDVKPDKTTIYARVSVLRPEALMDSGDPTAYGLPDVSSTGVWSGLVALTPLVGESPHFTVFPEPGAGADNPYRSECVSSRHPVARPDGPCLTYRFGMITGKVVPGEGGNVKTAWAIVYGTVVVQNPKTPSSSILYADYDTYDPPFLGSTDAANPYLWHFEPSISLDGHLLVWHGCRNNDSVLEDCGKTVYSFNRTAGGVTGWSPPKSITKMYASHGAGAGAAEPVIAGVKFSDRYPIGKRPLLDAAGQPLPEWHVGPYPWLSFDASEIFFPVGWTGLASGRTAMTAIGVRTNFRLQHLDGAVNPSRTTLTVDPDGYTTDGPGGVDEYDHLYAAYSLNLNGFDSLTTQLMGGPASAPALGARGFERLFVGPIALSRSMWTPFADANSPLPRDRRPGVYSFNLSGSQRYVEVALTNVEDGSYVLYLPMNEMLIPEPRFRNFYKFDINRTPDTVAGQNGTLTGTLGPDGNRAYFPYEGHNAPGRWASYWATIEPHLFETPPPALPTDAVAVLGDRTQGAVGNAIYFRRAGAVTTTLNPTSMTALNNSNSNTIELWFRELRNTSGALFHLFQGVNLQIDVNAQGTVVVSTLVPAVSCETTAGLALDHRWHHIAVTRKRNVLEVFVDGSSACSYTHTSNIYYPNGSSAITVGPNDTSGPNDLWILIDEVAISKVQRSLDEIKSAALRFMTPPTTPLDPSSGSPMPVSAFAAAVPEPARTRLLEALAGSKPRIPVNEGMTHDQVGLVAELGRQLFIDPALSINNDISCASCHAPNAMFADIRMCGGVRCATSSGELGQFGTRNAPSILNRMFGAQHFWDGRSASLELQAVRPLVNPIEMGNATVDAVAREIAPLGRPTYSTRFATAFGSPGVTAQRIVQAIATYERTLLSGDSRFDRRMLTPAEQRGEALFFGKARCSSCHRGANFTDELFHNNGIDTSAPSADLGLMAVTLRESDRGKFKTPSLRDVVRTQPYFHDGRFRTLAQVVAFYNAATSVANGDLAIRPLGLSPQEQADVVAFLSSLSGSTTHRNAQGVLLPPSPEIVGGGSSGPTGWVAGWNYDAAGAPTVQLSSTAAFDSPVTVTGNFYSAASPSGWSGAGKWHNYTFNVPAGPLQSGSLYARVTSGGYASVTRKIR